MALTLCPVALTAGCQRCPIVRVCPLKSVIGDQPPASSAAQAEPKSAKPARKGGTKKAAGKR